MLGKLFDKWAGRRQTKELAAFVNNLKSMDASEIGMVVAGATHVRHQLEDLGYDLFNPTVFVTARPEAIYELSNQIATLQKEGRLTDAAALMVWIHTLRASARLELRQLGRDMWRELERGFPHVEQARADAQALFNTTMNIAGYESFPEGLTPEPLA